MTLARQFQTAVLLQILLLVPLRLKNLAGLPGGEMFIVLGKLDMKNEPPWRRRSPPKPPP